MTTNVTFGEAVEWLTHFFGRDRAIEIADNAKVMPMMFNRAGIHYVIQGYGFYVPNYRVTSTNLIK